jgi:hypothetical protein
VGTGEHFSAAGSMRHYVPSTYARIIVAAARLSKGAVLDRWSCGAERAVLERYRFDSQGEERMRDCSWTRVGTVGRPENGHPRAIETAGASMRERVGPVVPASGAPIQRRAFGMLVDPASNGGRT